MGFHDSATGSDLHETKVTTGTAKPTTTPDFVGQELYDSVTNTRYVAVNTDDASGWKPQLAEHIGSHGIIFRTTGDTDLTLPASGSLSSNDATEDLENKTIDGDDNNTFSNIPIASLKTVLADADKVIKRDASGNVVSGKIIDANVTDVAAGKVTVTASGNIESSNVADALNELQSDIDTRALDSDLDTTNTEVSAAQSDIDDHLADSDGAHAATAISVAPTGNISSSTVQAALNELQGDINKLNLEPARINFLQLAGVQWNFETGVVNSWSTYSDTPGTAPVDATPTGTAVFVGASQAPRGSYSIQFNKTAATNMQGQGLCVDFTVHKQDAARELYVSIDTYANVNYTGNGDYEMRVYIYDKTNSALLDGYLVIPPGNYQEVRGYFTLSDSLSYRIILHNAGAGTDSFAINFDNILLGPDQIQLDLIRKNLRAAVIKDYIDFEDQDSDPDAPDAGKLRTFTKTGKQYQIDSDGNVSAVGSGAGGSGGKNYLQDWYDTTKALGTVQTLTATGNRTSNQNSWGESTSGTLTVNTSSPLRGTQDYMFTPTGDDDFIESPMWDPELADESKQQQLFLETYNLGVDGDFKIEIIRYDSSGTYQEASTLSGVIGTGVIPYEGYFGITSTTGDLYSFRITRLTSGTTAYRFTSISTGPQVQIIGDSVTNEFAYNTGTWDADNTSSFGTGADGTIMGGALTDARIKRVQFSDSTLPNDNFTVEFSSDRIVWLPSSANSTGGTLTVQAVNSNGSASSGVYLQSVSGSTTGVDVYFGRFKWLANDDSPSSEWPSNLYWRVRRTRVISNVAMANRALEEFAYNTSTSTTSGDTTSFGYGTSGAKIQAITTGLTRRIRFQTPINPTDKIIVEVKPSGATGWFSVESIPMDSSAGAWFVPWEYQNGKEYGMGRLSQVNSTDFDVRFGQYVLPSSTFGAAGQTWAAGTPAGGDGYWRVRKVSSGSLIGYPVGARNIEGDTSGTVVPARRIGEIKSSQLTGGDITLSASETSIVSLSLTPGRWLLLGQSSVSANSGGVSIFVQFYSGTTATLIGTAANELNNGSSARSNLNLIHYVDLSETTTIGISESYTGTATVLALNQRTTIMAVRVA